MISFIFAAVVLAAHPDLAGAPGANCSSNQKGGTSIGTQNNYFGAEKPQRHVSDPDVAIRLKAIPPPSDVTSIDVGTVQGEGIKEKRNLAIEILIYLQSKGYKVHGINSIISADLIDGISVSIAGQNKSYAVNVAVGEQ